VTTPRRRHEGHPGSAINLNLHFHALVLDGTYVSPRSALAPRCQPAAPLTDADVAEAGRAARPAQRAPLTAPRSPYLTDPIVVREVLAQLGHPTEPPRPAPNRSREELDFA
jgi:hypothetical protein